MNSTTLKKLNSLLILENYLALALAGFAAWIFYVVLMKSISAERHDIFRKLFRALAAQITVFSFFYAAHQALVSWPIEEFVSTQISLYLAFTTVILGGFLVIQVLRIVAFEYFFFASPRAGVPKLLINVCSLLLSLFIFGWLATSILDLQITSILTTSAVVSIVLGLALQDTLGNLFAAISLQIDKPFELDDWIELKNGDEKISGQVKELSWRATVLLAVTEEYITLPNRLIAQCQIVNFSGRLRPFYRGYFFRIPFSTSVADAKTALRKAISEIPEILSDPPSLIIITETTDSWVTLKVVYALTNYGSQYVIADKFYEAALRNLADAKIHLASPRLAISAPSYPVGRSN